jgi:general secretion pathway protein G
MKRPVICARKSKFEPSGFTLMEMLVVLVIIGLIAMVAIPQVTKLMGSAKGKAANIQLITLSSALRFYELDIGAYPTKAEGLQALWTMPGDMPGWNGPYIRQEQQLRDPWQRPFIYNIPGTKGPFELTSLGADGKPGGSGEDADISSIP